MVLEIILLVLVFFSGYVYLENRRFKHHLDVITTEYNLALQELHSVKKENREYKNLLAEQELKDFDEINDLV